VKRFIRVLLITCTIALGLTGCLRGSKVQTPPAAGDPGAKKIERIVSMAPSNTEIICALGAADRLVGVTAFCNYPEEATLKQKIGDFQINREKVLELEPDLVVGISGQEGVAQELEQHGIRTIILNPADFDGTLASILEMGEVLGASDRAAQIVESMKAKREEVRAALVGAEPVSVLVVLDVEGLWTVGPGTFLHELIEDAGGRNIAASANAPYLQLSIETIVEENPDVIIMTLPGKEELLAKPGFDRVKAVIDDRVLEVNADVVSRPGPRLADGLYEIARVLHPDRFK